MKEIAILERIMQEGGNCCWASALICEVCPLGKTVRNERGQYMSCVEAIDIEGLSEDEADAKYKQAAANKLADLYVQEVIEAE